MDEATSFRSLLKYHRKACHLTQAALAGHVGLDVKTIESYEQGRRSVPTTTVERLATVLALVGRERAVFLAMGGVSPPHALVSVSLLVPLTPLIGRIHEVEAVMHLITEENARLITLVGPPGIGKTRLALEIARTVTTMVADSAAFVPLASLTDPQLVPSTIARYLGVPENQSGFLVKQMIEALGNQRLLLVLDNWEQILGAAPIVTALLEGCEHLVVLATSRTPLGLYGEHEYLVPTLPSTDAVHLFMARAHAVKHSFQMTPDNAPIIDKICERLDRLPLAIELAAARCKLLTAGTLLVQLEHPLNVLTNGGQDRPSRQQTMRAAIDWSYNLLDATEQRLFARCATFNGGWTAEAAAVVCDIEGHLNGDALDGIRSLIDKSLLQHTPGSDGEPRFSMMETLRVYGRERLDEWGEVAALTERHARFYLALAESVAPQLTGLEQVAGLQRLDVEHDNLQAALLWALEHHDAVTAMRLSAALGRFWQLRGYLSEGRRWLEAALALPSSNEVTSSIQGATLLAAGILAQYIGDYASAQAHYIRSFQLFQETGETQSTIDVLDRLGELAWWQSDYAEATTWYEACLRLCRALGDQHGIARGLTNLGDTALLQGDVQRAIAFQAEGLMLFQRLGDRQGAALALNGLGKVAIFRSDHEQAKGFFMQCLALRRELGDQPGIASVLNNLGDVALFDGDYEQATAQYNESLRLCQELGDMQEYAWVSIGLGGVALLQGNYARAAMLFGQVLPWCREQRNILGLATVITGLGSAAYGQSDIATARVHFKEALPLWHSLGMIWGIAWGLDGYATVEATQGHWEWVARLYGMVATLRANREAPFPAERLHDASIVDAARTALSEAAFADAWAEGQAMPKEMAIAYVVELGTTPSQRVTTLPDALEGEH